jgi:hypothetical protein
MLSLIGRLAAAGALCSALTVPSFSQSTTLGCATGGPGGPFPTSGSGDGTYPTSLPTAPLIQTLAVGSLPVGATVVTEVKFHGLVHTYIGDCQFVLQDPAGTLHNIFCRPTGSCDYSGDYTIVAPCTGGMLPPATCTAFLTAGTYDQFFGTWTSGTNNIVNTPLNSIPAATGNWTLYIYDWAGADIGSLTSWDVCFGTPALIPVPGLPTQTAPATGSTVASPTTLTWTAGSCATQYSVEVDGIVYGPQVGLTYSFAGGVGTHNWRVRSENGAGIGPWTTMWSFDFPPPPPVCAELTTIYSNGNGGSNGGQFFFDMTVLNPAGINLGQIAVSTGESGPLTLSVYTMPTTYVGSTNNAAPWTLLTSGAGVGAGLNQPSIADLTDVVIPPGTYGVSLVLDVAHGFDYTNGTGTNQVYSNADVSISNGAANNVPWDPTPFTPRVFNGTLRYNCVGQAPVVYCTAGTSTHGCVPSISANANPSATFANPCNISITNIEGLKAGIVFYGINQNGFTAHPWAVGSNSYLCVKSPTQRTGVHNSGGTLGACDGTLLFDWNAYQTANPSSLGSPFAAGQRVYAQGWYRDPQASKTTNLSDALEMTYIP